VPSIIGLAAIALAGLVVLAGLTYVCTRVAARSQRPDPVVRGVAAAMAVLGALGALVNIVVVFIGTAIDADSDTYNGRQVLYLELSLTGSYALFGIFSLATFRLIRRSS
jgi:hypothetical protein